MTQDNTNEEERLVAEIPAELKGFVDADNRSNKEVVIAALWREFGGERMSALDRRIEEKERRVSMIKSEKNERERELERHREDLEQLRAKRSEVTSKKEQQAQELVEGAARDLTQSKWLSSVSIEEQLPDESDVEPYASDCSLSTAEFHRRVVDRIVELEGLEVDTDE